MFTFLCHEFKSYRSLNTICIYVILKNLMMAVTVSSLGSDVKQY